MKIFNKIVSAGLSEVVNSIGNAVDNVITNDEERSQAKEQLTEIVTNYSQSMTNSAKDVLVTEMGGNWLQRSWRPIIMLAFGFIVVYEYFLSKVFGWPAANLPENFWGLLEIGMGGFVIGRSAEKITKTLAENFDKLPGKKNR
jgi:hypothetical protein